MSILSPTIGGRQYVYLVRRSAVRMNRACFGPMVSGDVAAKVTSSREEPSIPSQFRHLFWDTDPLGIDLHQHAAYVIARILEAGSLRSVWWLQRQYTTRTILEVLASHKGLSARSRCFWSAWFEATWIP
jgi:hypothetical protein